jgi:hypothetical protein
MDVLDGAGAKSGAAVDELQRLQLLAQLGWRRHEHGFHVDHRGGAALTAVSLAILIWRNISTVPSVVFRHRARLSGQAGARSVLGVEGVGLAAHAPCELVPRLRTSTASH